MKPAVFLDRDNTLIHNDGDLGDPEQVRLMQGAASAVASLCGLGYLVVVITNQGGVARGKYTEQDVDKVHQRIRDLIERGANGARIERFYHCPYHPEGTVPEYACDHPHRKPQPGMILQAAKDLRLDLGQSWTIGDQIRDVQAGHAAGTRTILLTRESAAAINPNAAIYDDEPADPTSQPDFTARSLIEAVRIIAQQRKPESHEDVQRSPGGIRQWDAAAIARLQAQSAPPPDDIANNPDAATEVEAAHPPDPILPDPETASPAPPPEPEPAPPAPAPPAPENPANDRAASPPPATPAADNPDNNAPDQASESPPAAEETPDDEAPDDHAPGLAAIEHRLSQILRELRNQRPAPGDFSYAGALAIVLQMIVGVCLLGALWMGANDFELFIRWLGVGLLIQGATLALLLFERGSGNQG